MKTEREVYYQSKHKLKNITWATPKSTSDWLVKRNALS